MAPAFVYSAMDVQETEVIDSICYKYWSIDKLRHVKSLQSHLDGRSTDVSIDSRFGMFPQQLKIAITNEVNK